MEQKTNNCPFWRCDCYHKCQPPCRQQQELAKKAYELARDVEFSASEIAKILSCIMNGEDACKDAKRYSLHISNAIGTLIRMQSLIGDLREGGPK